MTNENELEKIVNNFTSISRTLKCSCGKPVARISLRKNSEKHAFYTEHNFSLRYKKLRDEYSGMDFEIERADKLIQIRKAMKDMDMEILRNVRDAVTLGDVMKDDGYCKQCNQMYCRDHHSIKVINEGQGSSTYESVCPKGHKWIWGGG